MPILERITSTSHLTVGEARETVLANSSVADLARLLEKRHSLGQKIITKLMAGESYEGWRALNLLILASGSIDDSQTGFWMVGEKLWSRNDTDSIDKHRDDLALGKALAANGEKTLMFLMLLNNNGGFLSKEELSQFNKSGGYESWMPVFWLSRGEWANDNQDGLRITQEGANFANEFFPLDPRLAALREFKRATRGLVWQAEDEILKLAGNIHLVSEEKIRKEIKKDGISMESLVNIDPLGLRDLVVTKELRMRYHLLSRMHRGNESRPYVLEDIKELKEILKLSSYQEFESYLEKLGKDYYDQLVEGDKDSAALTGGKIEMVKDVLESLKFVWAQSGPFEPHALQKLQQVLQVPFWSEDWKFVEGANTAYKLNHTKDSSEDNKIMVGSIVRLSAYWLKPDDPRLDMEFEVIGIKQGMFSNFYSHYQHVYVRDSQNWVHRYYLANLEMAR